MKHKLLIVNMLFAGLLLFLSGCHSAYDEQRIRYEAQIAAINQSIATQEADEEAKHDLEKKQQVKEYGEMADKCPKPGEGASDAQFFIAAMCVGRVSDQATTARIVGEIAHNAGGGRSGPQYIQPAPPQRGRNGWDYFLQALGIVVPALPGTVTAFQQDNIARINADRDIAISGNFVELASAGFSSNTAQSQSWADVVSGLPPTNQYGDNATFIGDNSQIGDRAGRDITGGNRGDDVGGDQFQGDVCVNCPSQSNNDNSTQPPADDGIMLPGPTVGPLPPEQPGAHLIQLIPTGGG